MKFHTERDLNSREAFREALNGYVDADLYEIPDVPYYVLDAQCDVLNILGVLAWQNCEFIDRDGTPTTDAPIVVRCSNSGYSPSVEDIDGALNKVGV